MSTYCQFALERKLQVDFWQFAHRKKSLISVYILIFCYVMKFVLDEWVCFPFTHNSLLGYDATCTRLLIFFSLIYRCTLIVNYEHCLVFFLLNLFDILVFGFLHIGNITEVCNLWSWRCLLNHTNWRREEIILKQVLFAPIQKRI